VGPREPEPFAYLLTWAHQLVGRSGVGMNGFAPLSAAEIAHWSALRGVTPSVLEVEALVAIDRVLRQPPEGEELAALEAAATAWWED
jgi:hypothetical protein